MGIPTDLYRPSLALLTDLYQLTMACAVWKAGLAHREAVFHLFFRRNPFQGGFTIAAGLEYALDYLANFRLDHTDLAYLETLRAPDGSVLLDPGFLDHLAKAPAGDALTLDVDAIPEGTVVFPQEPLLRVQGPIIPAMLVETPLLNLVNFQTLIATKAARIVHAARGEPVLDFGLRRAQGIDGALSASRAAHIGGCSSTSNVLAGKLFGIKVAGTHAHSFVMLFDSEREAFEAYARALPGNCVFLVDTYDTLEGVDHAIEVARGLRANGQTFLGVRLDSGDLAYLSIEARKRLDAAGFESARIFASNDLDEHVIESLKAQGATIAVWGVGTRLVTGHDEPALGGVYKLAAVRDPGGPWTYRVKLSEQAAKISTPGLLQVRRFEHDGEMIGDGLYDVAAGWTGERRIVDPFDPTRSKRVPETASATDLLIPVMRGGRGVRPSPPLAEIRAHARAQVSRLHAGIRRFLNPHQYPVGLEPSLHETRTRLVLEARRKVVS